MRTCQTTLPAPMFKCPTIINYYLSGRDTLRIAHKAIGKTYCKSMCFQFTERFFLLEFVHNRGLCILYGVSLWIAIGGRNPPTLTVSPILPIDEYRRCR